MARQKGKGKKCKNKIVFLGHFNCFTKDKVCISSVASFDKSNQLLKSEDIFNISSCTIRNSLLLPSLLRNFHTCLCLIMCIDPTLIPDTSYVSFFIKEEGTSNPMMSTIIVVFCDRVM